MEDFTQRDIVFIIATIQTSACGTNAKIQRVKVGNFDIFEKRIAIAHERIRRTLEASGSSISERAHETTDTTRRQDHLLLK